MKEYKRALRSKNEEEIKRCEDKLRHTYATIIMKDPECLIDAVKRDVKRYKY